MIIMNKQRKMAIYDNILTGLFVALVLLLVNVFNSYLPIEFSQNTIYLIDVVVLIFLIIVFVKTHPY